MVALSDLQQLCMEEACGEAAELEVRREDGCRRLLKGAWVSLTGWMV